MPGGGGREDGSRRPLCPLFAVFFLAFLVRSTWAEVSDRCPSTISESCRCDTGKLENRRGGWKITCTEPDYVVEYVPRTSVKVECSQEGQETPLAPAMFSKFNLTDVDYFQFVTCPLPSNLTLGEVLQGVTVKKLKFEGDAQGTYFDSSSFEGLTLLETLILKKNKVDSVPPDLFSNLTSLTSVELKENTLKSLPESLFEGLDNLQNINLADNELTELPPGIFANMTKLGKLYLSNNELSALPAGIFLGLKGLNVLDMANNRIQELHHELFLDTPKLKQLVMRGNNLARLQSDLLQGTKYLEELDLGDNRLTKLPETFLEGLNALKKISLNNCNLKGVGEAFFSHAPHLTSISMNNNKLTSISQDLFKRNRDLKKLFIQHNDISELPSNIFDKNINLETLKITHNNLTSLPKEIFDYLINLQLLDISGNAFKTLDAELLHQNQKLVELYISKNQLTEVKEYLPFGKSSGLKIVDLSYNHITSFPWNGINWGIHTSLEKLALNNNNITILTVPELFSVGTSIDLTNNEVRTVIVQRVWNTMKVELRGNPFECDCRLSQFLSYASHKDPKRLVDFIDFEDLECQEPSGLSGERLAEVRPDNLVCEVTEDCPWSCSCIEMAVTWSIVVKCSDLTELPDKLPKGTSEVHLEDNGISNLSHLGSPVWENITALYLNRNNITIRDWVLPPRLQTLSLAGNKLEYLSKSLTDYVENNDGVRLFLGDNPWLCDCQTLQLKDWLLENRKKIPDIDDMYCGHPVLFKNGSEIRSSVVRLTSDICPDENTMDNSQILIVSVICAILACMLFVVSVLYYRNKQVVIAYFYINFHNVFVCLFSDDDLDEDKTFDAFVSYSSADHDVAMDLVRHLENGDPSFKLCIHERDWLPGNLISWNIVNSVQNSRKTILVLSKHFLDSVWFQVEFHTAYYQMLEDRIDRLIVVVRGDLPEKNTLDKDLQYLLSTKTFLQWGERWFWEKLRYALPHRRSSGGNAVTSQKSIPPDKSFPLSQRPSPDLVKTVEEKVVPASDDTKLSKKREAQSDNSQTTVSGENKTGTLPVNSNKALSRRFNGARTNVAEIESENRSNCEAPQEVVLA